MPIFISPHIAANLCPRNCKIYVSSKKKSSKEEKESKIHVCVFLYFYSWSYSNNINFLFYIYIFRKGNIKFVPWREAWSSWETFERRKKPVLAPYSNKSQSLFHNLSLLVCHDSALLEIYIKKCCMRARDDDENKETQRGLRESYRNRPRDLS